MNVPKPLLSIVIVNWNTRDSLRECLIRLPDACQDLAFDRGELLYSIPKRFGVARALRISAILHGFMVILLASVLLSAGLGLLSLAGLGLVTMLLAYEHSLVRPSDLSRVNAAFFTINGWISVLLLVITGADIFWHRAS